MTPTTVGLVLVEGDGVAGVTKGHDAFEVRRGGFSPVTTSEFVAEALSRTQAIAGGQRLQSIGVTWSDDASVEASLLLNSLADSGFDNVVPIRLPEATEAFARGIGEVIGSDVTAVCVVEPDAVVALVVDSIENSVQTAVSYDLETEQDLIGWLTELLARAGWQPDGLVLLGSGDEFDTIARELEQILGIPVLAPAEAELALARGAALASVNTIDLFDDPVFALCAPPAPRRSPSAAHRAPLALLVGGVVAFVVSASVAVGLELLPDRGVRSEHREVVNTAETPALKPAAVLPAPAPLPEALPTPAEQALPAAPPETMSAPMPEQAVEPAMTMNPTDPAPQAPVVDASADPAAAGPVPQAPVEATVPTVPEAKPSLRTRILERLADLRSDPAPGG
ncbi:hypothetical protein [Mycolicibacterium sp. CH28]|uniref:DUF7159 family protein n=1 Tax=Mycolicibacterium sp. CH28 TaxID=2512237 RepID=UPI001F3CB1C6|nr:hypothetical protein [Mycolicibacterium sp. CH28]